MPRLASGTQVANGLLKASKKTNKLHQISAVNALVNSWQYSDDRPVMSEELIASNLSSIHDQVQSLFTNAATLNADFTGAGKDGL